MSQVCWNQLEIGCFSIIFIFDSSEKQETRHVTEQNFVIILYKYTLSHTRPLTSVSTKLRFRLGEFVMRSCCSKIIASLCIKVRHWKDMNVNVTAEFEIILCQHHVITGCFCLVDIFASTKYLSVIY